MNVTKINSKDDLEIKLKQSEYHILFIERGQGILIVESDAIILSDGACISITPNIIVVYDQIKSISGWLVSFREEFLTSFFANPFFIYRFQFFYSIEHPCYFTLSKESLEKFLFTIRKMEEEIHLNKLDSPHALRAMLYFKLIQLNRHYAKYYNLTEDTEQKEALVFMFKKLLYQNIQTKQRVNDYTSVLKVSRPHLNKLCREYFKAKPSDLIKSMILKLIKREILYSGKNMTEISFEFHFSDLSNFTRFFKKNLGCSPTDFKESFLKNSSSFTKR